MVPPLFDLTPTTIELIDSLLGRSPRFWDPLLGQTRDLELLRRIGDERELGAIPYLVSMLFDATPRGRAAQRAVARILENRSDEELCRFDDRYRTFNLYRLGNIGRPIRASDVVKLQIAQGAEHAVLGVLSCHVSGYVREAAVRRLGELVGGQEAPFLVIRLNDWVAPVRAAAWTILYERLARGEFWPFFRHLHLVLRLRHCGREDHREFVNAVLSHLWSSVSLPFFEQVLAGTSRWGRRELYREAVTTDGPQRELAITNALHHRDAVLRLWAIRDAAKYFTDDRLLGLLDTARGDAFSPVRREAIQIYIDRFPEHLPQVLRSGLFDDNAGVRDFVHFYWRKLELGDAASIYRNLLTKKLATVGIVAGLGETGSHEDVLWLRPMLRSDSPKVRSAAVLAIARLSEEEEDSERLVALLEDRSSRVVATVAKCLAKKSQEISPERLMDVYRRQSRGAAQREVFRVLQEMSLWPTVPALIEIAAMADESIAENVRKYLLSQSASVWTAPTPAQLAEIRAAFEQFADALDPEFVREVSQWIESRAAS